MNSKFNFEISSASGLVTTILMFSEGLTIDLESFFFRDIWRLETAFESLNKRICYWFEKTESYLIGNKRCDGAVWYTWIDSKFLEG